jgi:hypothetical protein
MAFSDGRHLGRVVFDLVGPPVEHGRRGQCHERLPDTIPTALSCLLNEGSFRDAAASVRAEITSMPLADEVAPVLEELL